MSERGSIPGESTSHDSAGARDSMQQETPGEEEEAAHNGRGCVQCTACILGITVEPVLLIHNIASSMMWVTGQDLMTEKACKVNLGMTDEVCDHLKDHEEQQTSVHDLVSDILMWRSILETSIKIIFVLFLGAWSDRWGRKIPLLLSVFGLFGEAFVYMVLYYSPSWPLETILVASMPYALSGGTHALLMLCFSHLADRTRTKQRTLRLGLLDAAYYMGKPVGMALLNPMLDWGGTIAVFVFVIILYCVAFGYVLVRLKRKEQSEENRGRNLCKDCSFGDITEAVRSTCKHRENYATPYILILILGMMFDSLPVWGESNVKYLFTQSALGWTHTEYSRWGTLSSFLNVVGALVLVPLMTHILMVSDMVMGIIGAISRTGANVIYGVVTSSNQAWLMYTGAVVATGSPLAPIAIRTSLSKLAGSQDVGKVYAVMAAGECMMPFIAAPIYNAIYTSSSSLPGSYNFFSASSNFLMGVCFMVVMISSKMRKKRENTLSNNEADISSSTANLEEEDTDNKI